jgi:isocitrate/isopropylmalate dehydrogenase
MIELLELIGWYRVVHSHTLFGDLLNDLVSNCNATLGN